MLTLGGKLRAVTSAGRALRFRGLMRRSLLLRMAMLLW